MATREEISVMSLDTNLTGRMTLLIGFSTGVSRHQVDDCDRTAAQPSPEPGRCDRRVF